MCAQTASAIRTPRIPKEIWVLIGAGFIIAVGFGIITPVLPQFARSFDVGVTAASVVVSAFAFFRLVFAPLGGRLVSGLGERPVYLAGLLIVALSTGATAFADSYIQLLLYRSLGGIGSTMFTVSSAALIIRLAPPPIRGRVSSVFASAFLLGGVVGPLVGGLLGGFGLRVPFIVYAVALLIAAAVVATFLSGARLRELRTSSTQPPMTFREATRDSAFRSALVSSFAHGWSNFGVRMAIIPLFVTAVLVGTAHEQRSAQLAGIAIATFAAGNALALTFSGRLADTIGRKPPVMGGLIVSGVTTLILGFVSNIWVILLLCAIAGAGAGVLNPAQQATVADIVGNERSGGGVLAGYQMAMDTGTIIGPVLVGFLIDWLGYAEGFLATGLILLLAAVAWIPARETLPTRRLG
ncbi:MAG: MFS transporter [Actinomycetales bacterium]|nr:MFS transporter [Tetrasphaera sp.]NLW98621.1 MFS transporter [Actinomycetales bacterium]